MSKRFEKKIIHPDQGEANTVLYFEYNMKTQFSRCQKIRVYVNFFKCSNNINSIWITKAKKNVLTHK
jgi:hypothetical protein